MNRATTMTKRFRALAASHARARPRRRSGRPGLREPRRERAGNLSGVVNTYFPPFGGSVTIGPGSTSVALGTRVVPQGRRRRAISSSSSRCQCGNLNSTDSSSYGDGVAGEPAQGYTDPAGTCVAGRYQFVRAGPRDQRDHDRPHRDAAHRHLCTGGRGRRARPARVPDRARSPAFVGDSHRHGDCVALGRRDRRRGGARRRGRSQLGRAGRQRDRARFPRRRGPQPPVWRRSAHQSVRHDRCERPPRLERRGHRRHAALRPQRHQSDRHRSRHLGRQRHGGLSERRLRARRAGQRRRRRRDRLELGPRQRRRRRRRQRRRGRLRRVRLARCGVGRYPGELRRHR